jgi:hypothetical protein
LGNRQGFGKGSGLFVGERRNSVPVVSSGITGNGVINRTEQLGDQHVSGPGTFASSVNVSAEIGGDAGSIYAPKIHSGPGVGILEGGLGRVGEYPYLVSGNVDVSIGVVGGIRDAYGIKKG